MFNTQTNHFCKQLKIKHPIIQAPMAGGIVTPELIHEVFKAGGLGSLPLGYLSLNDANELIQKTIQLTPLFAVNIFIPSPPIDIPPIHIENMLLHINQYRQTLNLKPLTDIPLKKEPAMDDLIDMIIASTVPILSFVFGILDDKNIQRLKQNGIYVIGTATTIEEGLALEQAGCDAIVAQGLEAGGHRGGFLNHNDDTFIKTMPLVSMMVDALKIPVIAAGGIMNGHHVANAIKHGASAVQMGTAFLTSKESQASALHKQLILEKSAPETYLTKAFTGKLVRCLKNQFVIETEHQFSSNEILPYPLQHQLTQELRSIAKKQNAFHYAGFWSGQATHLARNLSVQALMIELEQETKTTLKNM